MVPRKYSYHYSRNLKSALILSLGLIILIFYLAPEISIWNRNTPTQHIIFFSSDIPPTIQSAELKNAASHKPSEPKIAFTGNPEAVDILKDVSVKDNTSTANSLRGKGYTGNKNGVISKLPFIPRQILEVIPKKVDENVKGIITLSLKIGKDGKVVSYTVLNNTTNCTECLENVLTAIHKSQWEPASVNGNKIEYWIQKSYKFN